MSIRERAAWAAAGVLGLMIVAALSGVVTGGPLDPPGSPGSTQPQVEPRSPIPPVGWNGAYPITISQSGSYFLTRNLEPTGGHDAIVINNGDIDIDLNGFMIDGEAGPGNDGVSDAGTGYPNITVRNGTIRGFTDDGIDLQMSGNVRVSEITIGFSGGSGIEIGSGSVTDCTARGPDTGTVGIRASGVAEISDCVVEGYATGFALNGGGILRDCITNSADVTGIFAGAGSTVTNCRVNNVGVNDGTGPKHGLYTQGPSLIRDNAIHGVLDSPFNDAAINVQGRANVITGNLLSGMQIGLNFEGGAYGTDVYGNTFDTNISTYYVGETADDDIGPTRPYDDGFGAWDQVLSSAGLESCATPRFQCVMSNLAVLDRETGLVWERSAGGGTYSWAAAHDACQDGTFAGRKGWRLPRLDELQSLDLWLLTTHPFTGMGSLSFWSSTPSSTSPGFARWYSLGSGAQGSAATTDALPVHCVRGPGT